MTDREKLIELFVESAAMDYKDSAEYFITNGVTVQKWIPSSEPPKEWKDDNGDAINYLIYSPGIGVDIGNWIESAKAWFCLVVPFKVTHWMPLPEPPKEE